TPSPSLEMYSSFEQSILTFPCSLSRKDCAAGHCAASRRPATTTVPPAPKSIASIFFSFLRHAHQRLAERGPALPARLHVAVLDGLDELVDAAQPEAAGRPPLERRRAVGV